MDEKIHQIKYLQFNHTVNPEIRSAGNEQFQTRFLAYKSIILYFDKKKWNERVKLLYYVAVFSNKFSMRFKISIKLMDCNNND